MWLIRGLDLERLLAKRILPKNRVWFSSVEDADSLGYRPCAPCSPSDRKIQGANSGLKAGVSPYVIYK
jgi:methylphosphotriester-DNA--protein-cysteine methyltransferase